ncbi:MAG: hypothetical protein IT236_08355, partial [Bacteroidia bacterium]|nr:hypothetical protein [Bacteroidia bacterium]
YSGYGFDIYGQQNNFANSSIYQKIINEYGGGYGQQDLVAQALGVDPQMWTFNESDMPTNMHYVPTIMVGFNFKLPVDKKSSFLLNVNGSKLGVEGNFTMTTKRPPTTINPAVTSNVVICPIKGKEQRLQFEFGFQRLFGGDDKLNFLGEVGFVGTLTKFDRNWIQINTLQIDLTYYSNQAFYPNVVPNRVPLGFGVGAFVGTGINVAVNPKFTMQLLYSLSHEKVNIGVRPVLKLQNAIGLRVYYNI